jgi:putative tryptophan/tyrosine transport system substrate-binding protein
MRKTDANKNFRMASHIRSLAAAFFILATVAPAMHARAADKPVHIGILSSGSVELRAGLERALLDGLREQGYVEGKNLVIERRYALTNLPVKVPEYARELAGMKLDAIVTTCTPSTRAAKEATTTTPVVMAAVSDPVGQHIIASLAKPGQNITGRSSQAEELLAKRLELLAGVTPKSSTVAVLVDTRNPVHALNWPRMEKAAQQLKLKLLRLDVSNADEISAGIDSAARAHAAALFVMPDDPLFYNTRVGIVERAAANRLPDFYWSSDYVETGGLMSYGENLPSSYYGAAAYIDKIVKGSNPSTLPVAQPTRFELVINRKTAKTLGITIPGELLVRADRVIE